MQFTVCKPLFVLPCQAIETGEPKHCLTAGRLGLKTKILRVMKITAILLLIACLHVQAAGYGQGITLSEKEVPVTKVFQEIRKQTGYLFLFNDQDLEGLKKVTVYVKGATIKEVLYICFQGQPLTFSIKDKTIIISRKTIIPVNTKDYRSQPIDVRGRVINENGEPVSGVTVSVKGGKNMTTTNNNGEFILAGVNPNSVLIFTHVSLETFELKVGGKTDLAITLKNKVNALGDVIVTVNTGYQQLPKERATGSFAQIDNELLNRRVSTSILDRLEGIASGVRFQTSIGTNTTESPISIRGRSTILSNTQPLIIVDNFPYEGDLNNINPNDIESITILKDAAAASIWGARSSNGVIVITTKRGSYNQVLKAELNTNVTIGEKPDLFYDPNFMTPSEFAEVETFLFNKGFYDANLNNTTSRPAIMPITEILSRRRAGLISAEDSANQISILSNHDVRNDFSNHFYRNSTFQQHALNFSGGTQKSAYRFSIGYDKNLSSLIRNQYNRFTISSYNSFRPTKNLELTATATFTQSELDNNNPGNSINTTTQNLYPYAALADENGNSLALPKDYRQAYKDTTGNGRLLDWNYRPLEEIFLANNQTKSNNLRISPSIKYTIIKGLSAEVRYQYEKQISETKNLQSQQSYYTRNLINLYTQFNNGNISRPIPIGDILDQSNGDLVSKNIRAQLNFDRTFSAKHSIFLIGGIETREVLSESDQFRIYGYDHEHTTINTSLDYVTKFSSWQNLRSSTSIIPLANFTEINSTIDEYVSYFANAAYTLNKRYTFTASGRIDQSNLFGVTFNQKGVPLWSVGSSWKLSDESFYRIKWLPYLNLRATYGYNGNINKSVSALTTISYLSTNSDLNLIRSNVNNAPNDSLRWEKIGTLNLGVDFELFNNILTGSIEYYRRKGNDLIGNFPVAPSSGLTTFTANVANMKAHGVDVELKSRILNRNLTWVSDLLFSYTIDKVTRYDRIATPLATVSTGDGSQNNIAPVVGRPVYSVYSFRWAGLDPANGDPQGYWNDQVSKDYPSIVNNSSPSDLVYAGPARPPFFGAFRNTFSLQNFSLSVNITYKLGYFFRASTINYNNLYNSNTMHKDYSLRWTKPGDEAFTSVPSMDYPISSLYRTLYFYPYSEATVHKGDHIRLQDIQIAYSLKNKVSKFLNIRSCQLYVYLNNLGILWKANEKSLDPDYLSGYPNPRTASIGLRVGF